MTASNLSICVGPSILWSSDAAYMMDQTYSKEVAAIVQILVEEFEKLFGPETPVLFLQKVGAKKSKQMVVMVGGSISFWVKFIILVTGYTLPSIGCQI